MLLFCLGIVLLENWAVFVALSWVANSLLNFKIASDVTFALELFCARRFCFIGYMGFGLLSVSTVLFFARFFVSRLAFALGFGVGVNAKSVIFEDGVHVSHLLENRGKLMIGIHAD